MNNIILIQRIAHAATGILFLFLVTNYLTIYEQGWYYAFLTLAGFYTLFDFGYSESLLHLSSSKTSNDEDLLRYSAPRYLKSTIIFFILFAIVGYIFFSFQDQNLPYNWTFIWLLLCLSSATFLFLMPMFAILQGAGHIKEVYFIKLLQNISSILLFVIIVFYFVGLLATIAISISAVLVQVVYLIKKHRRLFYIYIHSVLPKHSIELPKEKFIFHVGISWLAGYMITQFQILIIFIYLSVELSGQFGLTLAMLNTILLIASSKLHLSIPSMTQEATNKNHKILDHIYVKSIRELFQIYISGVVIVSMLYFYEDLNILTSRMLSLDLMIFLAVAILVNQIIGSMIIYTRSFLVDPLFKINSLSSLIILFLSTITIKTYGVYGPLMSLLGTQLIIVLPWAIRSIIGIKNV